MNRRILQEKEQEKVLDLFGADDGVLYEVHLGGGFDLVEGGGLEPNIRGRHLLLLKIPSTQLVITLETCSSSPIYIWSAPLIIVVVTLTGLACFFMHAVSSSRSFSPAITY